MKYDTYPPSITEDWNYIEFIKDEIPDGKLIYDEIYNAGCLFPLQRKRELSKMLENAREIQPKCIYEIGSDKGGSLYHWIKAIPSVECVIACEIRGIPFQSHFEKMFPHIRFLWLEGPSISAGIVSKVKNFTYGNGPIDCMFIDGDKSGFLKDFNTYLPLTSPNGRMYLHDVNPKGGAPEPRSAFNTISNSGYKTSTIIDTSEWDEENMRPIPFTLRTQYINWLRHWKGNSCGVGVVDLSERST